LILHAFLLELGFEHHEFLLVYDIDICWEIFVVDDHVVSLKLIFVE